MSSGGLRRTSPKGATGGGPQGPPSRALQRLIRVGDDFEEEYPGASALATECFANLVRTGTLLLELHNRQSQDDHQLSGSARQVLAIVEGAGRPLEPSTIGERVFVTTGTMTSVLDTLEKRGLIQRLPHPGDRRKLLIDITPDARAILDELLPSLHARERDVMARALSTVEQRALLRLIAKVQHAAIDVGTTPPRRDGVRRRAGCSPTA